MNSITHYLAGRCLLLLATLGVCLHAGAAANYQDRFVWVFGWNLGQDGDVPVIAQLLDTAATNGLNGAVFSAGLDSLSTQPPEYFRRLKEVKEACDRNRLELIPAVFSVGYGGAILGHNRQLAEGLPVSDAPCVVHNLEARLAPDPDVRIVNGDFEAFTGPRFAAFAFHDQPGTISFVDTQVTHGGRAALRLEHFTANPHGHGRVEQRVSVRPHRCYRVSLWVKTEGLKPASAFQILALVDNRELSPRSFKLPATTDWRKLTLLVNSGTHRSISLYAGVWGGKEGTLWLDDWTLEEVGPLNVLRRPGTPVTVRSEDGSVTYTEGRDFAPLADPGFNFYNVDREAPPLRLLPGGRIVEGQRLRVSWFHPMVVHDSQVTVCMAEPELYAIWEREAKLLADTLHPRRILLNMDEVRMGGTCQACQGRNMGELLGACITRQVEILRRFNPGAQIYIWSDMLDPHHNAHGDYYLVQGSFAESWKHVPKDLIMAVWGGEPREKSLRFFEQEGFPTLIACYYDADDLKDVKGWLDLVREPTQVRGFMYTPWLKKYGLLPAFGQLIGGR